MTTMHGSPLLDTLNDATSAPLRFSAQDLLASGERDILRGIVADVDAIESSAASPDEALRALVARYGQDGVLESLTVGRDGSPVAIRKVCLLREILGEASPLADLAFAMQGLGSFPITLAGIEASKAFLPPIMSGSAVAAFALTEPEAGTDLSRMSTRAVRDGSDYVIRGEKVFISNATVADRFTVFAVTDDKKPRGHVSAFVVDRDTEGLTTTPTEVLGGHPIGSVRFDDVRIPKARLLGQEGDGMKLALATLSRFRPTVGAAAIGFGRRAMRLALQHCKERIQFGAPLAKLTAVQHRISDMACELDAATALVYRAASVIDSGGDRGDISWTGSMAKLMATEAAQRVVDSAVQLHGGLGVVKSPTGQGVSVARLYEDVRSLRIYEGTNDVHKAIIASALTAD